MEEITKHEEALSILCSIPGIDITAAAAIIAEIGTDMSAFPDSQHICSWAGLTMKVPENVRVLTLIKVIRI